MENTEFAKKVAEFNRSAAENTWNAVTLWQDQAERFTRAALESGHNLAEEGQRMVEEWVKEYKKGRTAAKKTMEESYRNPGAWFAGTLGNAPNKAKAKG